MESLVSLLEQFVDSVSKNGYDGEAESVKAKTKLSRLASGMPFSGPEYKMCYRAMSEHRIVDVCKSVPKGTNEGFSHAARILGCMDGLVGRLSKDATPDTGAGKIVSETLVKPSALPAAAAMIARLAPAPGSPRAAWSHVVMITEAGGARHRLSVSAAVTLLIGKLLAVVVGVVAWVEQGLEREQEGQQNTPAGSGVTHSSVSGLDVQPPLPLSWRQLSERLNNALTARLDSPQSCHSLTIKMLSACLSALCKSSESKPAPSQVAIKMGTSYYLDVKGAGVGIWLQRSSLLINRVYLHKLGVGSPKVQTLDAFVDLNAAVYKAVHAALLGPRQRRLPRVCPEVVVLLRQAALMLHTAGYAMERVLAHHCSVSNDNDMEDEDCLMCSLAQAVGTLIPAAFRATSLPDAGAAAAARAVVVEGLWVLQVCSKHPYLSFAICQSILTPATAATLELVAMKGLEPPPVPVGPMAPPAGCTRDTGQAALVATGRPSVHTCAWFVLIWMLSNSRKVDVTAQTQRLAQQLPTYLNHITDSLRGGVSSPTDGVGGAKAFSEIASDDACLTAASKPACRVRPTYPVSPHEAAAAHAAAWHLLEKRVAQQDLQWSADMHMLIAACVRLHRAVVGAYMAAAPGRERDVWRAALMQHEVPLRTVSVCNSLITWAGKQPERSVVHQVRSHILTLVPWSLPVLAAALVQQTAQRVGPPGGRRAASHRQDAGNDDAWLIMQLRYTIGDMSEDFSATCLFVGKEIFPIRGCMNNVLGPLSSKPQAADNKPPPRATCAAALAALRSGCVEGLQEGAAELLWVMQLAEWLPRIGQAVRVIDAIAEKEGIQFGSLALDLFIGVLLLLPHVLEAWATLSEGGAVTSGDAFTASLAARIRTELLAGMEPASGHTGCPSTVGATTSAPGSTPDDRGASSERGGGIAIAAGDVSQELAEAEVLLCQVAGAPSDSSSCDVGVTPCLKVLHGELVRLQGFGSSGGCTDDLLIRVGRSALVRRLHEWCGQRCAAAVARMEAACRG